MCAYVCRAVLLPRCWLTVAVPLTLYEPVAWLSPLMRWLHLIPKLFVAPPLHWPTSANCVRSTSQPHTSWLTYPSLCISMYVCLSVAEARAAARSLAVPAPYVALVAEDPATRSAAVLQLTGHAPHTQTHTQTQQQTQAPPPPLSPALPAATAAAVASPLLKSALSPRAPSVPSSPRRTPAAAPLYVRSEQQTHTQQQQQQQRVWWG